MKDVPVSTMPVQSWLGHRSNTTAPALSRSSSWWCTERGEHAMQNREPQAPGTTSIIRHPPSPTPETQHGGCKGFAASPRASMARCNRMPLHAPRTRYQQQRTCGASTSQ
jgi:hypothetical protein